MCQNLKGNSDAKGLKYVSLTNLELRTLYHVQDAVFEKKIKKYIACR